jgi:DNA-binding LytR/AlgR family response regulator
MMNVVIVDDEPLAIDLIKAYLARIPNMKLLETFSDAINAFSYLKSVNVDLVFLDINMPEISGIELAKSLKKPPMFIFITAYREFAVEGFNLSAVDYLLKPVSFERFKLAIEKAIELNTLKANSNQISLNYVVVKSDYQSIKIVTRKIIYIEGLDDYIRIYTVSGIVQTLMSLKSFLELLPENEFIRIHRSFIVSVARITSFSKRSVFINEIEIPIGTTYLGSFLERIN